MIHPSAPRPVGIGITTVVGVRPNPARPAVPQPVLRDNIGTVRLVSPLQPPIAPVDNTGTARPA